MFCTLFSSSRAGTEKLGWAPGVVEGLLSKGSGKFGVRDSTDSNESVHLLVGLSFLR